MWISTWIAKAKIEKDYHYDYDEELLYKLNSRTGRAFGDTEEDMRHAMTKTLRRIDTDKCLQKLVCFLEEQSDRSQEEDLLLKLFPVTHCKSSVFPRCTATEEQLRELMHYYQNVEMKRTISVLEKEVL
ncbi:hypothetical protein E2C01_079268 [Portunus trituberculatus]|uniref:Uncharacterized protein n=1 Tax=Portunus trituberculatus TaxID=210409 RepID=A0A5B7IQZ7_PORTR|nr:hypothetical protein [Portunus trituberculatus]